eukprot:1235027-Amphidinium_carterae.1
MSFGQGVMGLIVADRVLGTIDCCTSRNMTLSCTSTAPKRRNKGHTTAQHMILLQNDLRSPPALVAEIYAHSSQQTRHCSMMWA